MYWAYFGPLTMSNIRLIYTMTLPRRLVEIIFSSPQRISAKDIINFYFVSSATSFIAMTCLSKMLLTKILTFSIGNSVLSNSSVSSCQFKTRISLSGILEMQYFKSLQKHSLKTTGNKSSPSFLSKSTSSAHLSNAISKSRRGYTFYSV